jgi:hypothetical protein
VRGPRTRSSSAMRPVRSGHPELRRLPTRWHRREERRRAETGQHDVAAPHRRHPGAARADSCFRVRHASTSSRDASARPAARYAPGSTPSQRARGRAQSDRLARSSGCRRGTHSPRACPQSRAGASG